MIDSVMKDQDERRGTRQPENHRHSLRTILFCHLFLKSAVKPVTAHCTVTRACWWAWNGFQVLPSLLITAETAVVPDSTGKYAICNMKRAHGLVISLFQSCRRSSFYLIECLCDNQYSCRYTQSAKTIPSLRPWTSWASVSCQQTWWHVEVVATPAWIKSKIFQPLILIYAIWFG